MSHPKSPKRKGKRLDFNGILFLLMVVVACTSALIGFLFGRSAIDQVNPNPTDRRVLRQNQLDKPRKVNFLPRSWEHYVATVPQSSSKCNR